MRSAWQAGLCWLSTLGLGGISGQRSDAPREVIRVVSRRALSAQQSLVVVEIWGQQMVLAVQPGVAPTVLATRDAAAQDAGLRSHRATTFSQHLNELRSSGALEDRPCA
ncbi:MAG: flagellar biosynthetic protein FliO [Bryobacterales bacterium]|nr:flagellar biosynthetic protein FliO [Bryobacterales bacterium]